MDARTLGAIVRYRTIVADPPWNVLRPAGGTWAGNSSGNRPQTYPTMSLAEIKALRVEAWADDDAHLYLWTVNKYVEDAYAVARAWGFAPSALLTWCKKPQGKGPGGLFSITSEFVLYAKRGSEPRRMVIPTSWFTWPRRSQSSKPEAFYDLVESVSHGPYLEMFARRARFGWDYWGDESLSTVEMPA